MNLLEAAHTAGRGGTIARRDWLPIKYLLVQDYQPKSDEIDEIAVIIVDGWDVSSYEFTQDDIELDDWYIVAQSFRKFPPTIKEGKAS